ncbi:MAG: cysteine rich repeat-containing protein [Azospirillaceae bacterium]|nr:cysteine rich repeat-containing protein [Azospirillaceae bacterium]
MTRMITRGVAALSLMAALAAVPAFAQDQRAAMKSCQPDRQALCKDVQPGGGRILACLKQNEDKLSADCKAALANFPAPKQGS